MDPAVAAGRFLRGIPLGLALGLWYGFLRPLGRGRSLLRDGLFLLALVPAWVWFSFAVCQGDLQLGYYGGLLAGGFLWEGTLGWYLRPVWQWFWGQIRAVFQFFGKFFRKIATFLKKTFAYGKNYSKIK